MLMLMLYTKGSAQNLGPWSFWRRLQQLKCPMHTIFLRNFKVIDNQRRLMELSYQIEPSKRKRL